MKFSALRFTYLILTVSLCCCDSTPNQVSNYTPVNPKDSLHSSGGLANTTRGHEIFIHRCSACHGISGNARGNNAADLQLTRLDSISIATTIRNGRGAMPMFIPAVLPDSDLAQVEMYIKTIRK